MIDSIPRFLQGVFAFTGTGYHEPQPLDATLRYTVPADRRAQLIYLRAGNSADGMVYLGLLSGGRPIRLFPIGARASVHVPLAVVEDLPPDTVVSVQLGAPSGLAGTVVCDIGLVEI